MVTYGVVGAGRQGTATAYDIARFSPESRIELADSDPQAARMAADRINGLLGESRVVPRCLQIEQPEETRPFLKGVDVCASAAPYRLNLALAREAVASGVSFCDLGGNADIVEQELDLDLQALENGVSIVPDCGVGPGMISNLALLAFEQFDQAEEILIYDGGLPQDPQPPFHYRCFFNLEGLTNEYDGEAVYLDKGQVVRVPCFAEEEFEQVEVPELGELEAFTTSGGLTTLARTLEGKVFTLKNKTLRYPGHYALFKGLRDLGMLGLEPLNLASGKAVPRDLLHRLLADRISPHPGEQDLMVIHVRAAGLQDGSHREVQVDVLDRFDSATGFAAMERTTGFHMAIVAQSLGQGNVPAGAIPPELAVTAAKMVRELEKRDIQVKMSWATSDNVDTVLEVKQNLAFLEKESGF